MKVSTKLSKSDGIITHLKMPSLSSNLLIMTLPSCVGKLGIVVRQKKWNSFWEFKVTF